MHITIHHDFRYITTGNGLFEGSIDNDERFAFGWYNIAFVSLKADLTTVSL